MFGIPPEKQVIITAWTLEISKSSKFLYAIIATHGPYLEMLTSRTEGRTSTSLLELLLLIAQHTLYSIHRQEISVILSGPLVVVDAALLKLLFSLAVRLREIID